MILKNVLVEKKCMHREYAWSVLALAGDPCHSSRLRALLLEATM
jgi:hypothetical protein